MNLRDFFQKNKYLDAYKCKKILNTFSCVLTLKINMKSMPCLYSTRFLLYFACDGPSEEMYNIL